MMGIPGPKPRLVVDRIAEQVALDDSGCVIWLGALDVGGYGTLLIGSRRDGTRRGAKAHRALWELLNGPVPAGLELDHLCRVRECVRPDHLEPVTRRVNTLRGQTIPAVNAAKTHCDHGHAFDLANTYIHKGARVCRACKARQQRERRARRAAA